MGFEAGRLVVYVPAAAGDRAIARDPTLGMGGVYAARSALMDKTPPRATQTWHAISVVASVHACPAARALRGVRILSAQAPTLPLNDCIQRSSCICTYKHHKDRRAGPRRAWERSGFIRAIPVVERRVNPGRRANDRESSAQ